MVLERFPKVPSITTLEILQHQNNEGRPVQLLQFTVSVRQILSACYLLRSWTQCNVFRKKEILVLLPPPNQHPTHTLSHLLGTPIRLQTAKAMREERRFRHPSNQRVATWHNRWRSESHCLV
jgi:hypothetical protein